MLQRIASRIQQGETVRIVLYGDSISEVGRTPGYFGGAKSAEMNWGPQLGRLLKSKFPRAEFEIIHFAIGGQNSYEALGRLDWMPTPADLVLIELGTNDCAWHPLPSDVTSTAIGFLIDGIKARHQSDVAVVGMGGHNPLQPNLMHIDETNALLELTAGKKTVPFIDTRAAILAASGNGEKWADYHNGTTDCHPTDAGMTVWAKAAFNTLATNLG